MFKHGWAIYVFTLTADLDNNNEAFDLIRSGTTSIYVRFGRALTHGVNMVVYGELGMMKRKQSGVMLFTILLVVQIHYLCWTATGRSQRI